MTTDVAVLGGGLAGCAAALAAARRDPSATVRLVRHDADLPRTADGTIDVLGYVPGDDEPVASPRDAMDELPATHPYRLLGPETVVESLSRFDDLAGDRYAGSHTERNALVPTAAGSVRPTSRYPAGMGAGVLGSGDGVLFVGFERLPALSAPMVADALADRIPAATVRGVTVRFPRDDPKAPIGRDFAAALEANDDVARAGFTGSTDADGAVPVRDALADAIEPHHRGEDRVGVPAVLGLDAHAAVREHLADRLGADVFEVPVAPPHVPGIRLSSILFDRLATAGVHVLSGDVRGATTAGGRVESVTVAGVRGERSLAAESYVLATGGVESGGIETDRSRVTEPIFGCPVDAPEDRARWSRPDAFGDHAFARFGVAVDEELRPTGDDGVAYENLRAAGSILTGYNYVLEHSREGVAIATGDGAGRLAVDAA